ncbi:MAG TPA: molybdenum cofactor guanylyltransferase [Pyrinomonadaceae bacterium]
MDQVEAFILAGGASRRMGTDKAQLLIAEQTLMQRIAETLFEMFDSVTVVGPEISDRRIKTASDVYPKWGALGGLHAALNACQREWAFVIACDLPFVSKDLLIKLAELRDDNDAVVPIQPDDRPQPLAAFYRKSICLQQATELIETGKRRPLDLLDKVKTYWVPFAELVELPNSKNFFLNINTPEDYYEATQKATAHK